MTAWHAQFLGGCVNVETRRLRLRPVETSDVDALVLLDSDPEVMRFVSGGRPTPRAEISDWVVPRARAELRTGRGGMWIAIDQRYQAFLGWVLLRAPRHSQRSEMELSYRLRRDTWGRGLATEAARAVVGVAFDELHTERVFASTTLRNSSSRRVMEKLAMRVSSVRACSVDEIGPGAREHSGELEYELLRHHWEALVMQEDARRYQAVNLPA